MSAGHIAFFLFIAGTVTMFADPAGGNLLPNGSFEYAKNPDIPDYWTPSGVQIRSTGISGAELSLSRIAEMERKFVIDTGTAFHGRRSLRVESPFFIGSAGTKVEPDADYVFSVYLKSSRPNMKVRLAAVNFRRDKAYHAQTVRPGTEWTRFSLPLKKYPYKSLSVLIEPLEEGKLWADAAQLEKGLTPTPFVPAKEDIGFTEPQPPIHLGTSRRQSPPVLMAGSPLQTPPVIDGKRESAVWDKAATGSMRTILGAPSETPTEFKVLHDRKNLYLAFICGDPRGSRGKGESIEIFLDLLGAGSPFYQFLLTPDGEKTVHRSIHLKHEFNWPAEWSAAVSFTDGAWHAEVAIPWSIFPEVKEMAVLNSVKMNVARNYPPGPEIHLSWAPMHITFLEPENFGTVILNSHPAAKPEIVSRRWKATGAADNLYSALVRLKNPGKTPVRCMVLCEAENAGTSLQSKLVSSVIPAGALTDVTLPDFKFDDRRIRSTLSLIRGDGRIYSKSSGIEYVPAPIQAYTEFNYYTSEKTARIRVKKLRDLQIPQGAQMIFQLRLPPLATVLKTWKFAYDGKQKDFFLPLVRGHRAHTYSLEASVTTPGGSTLAKSIFPLVRREPRPNEVKINRINRVMYVNGTPFIPYGYQITPVTKDAVDYMKENGFDYVSCVGHWMSLQKNDELLKLCDENQIRVMNSYLIRAGAEDPLKFLRKMSPHPSLIAVNPIDESASPAVPDVIAAARAVNPYVVHFRSDNIATYNFWRNQLKEGVMTDALSFDRYPLISRAKGRPQTHSMIYSFERLAELADAEAKEENLPLFAWMEGAETNCMEPDRDELTYLHYIALVNHCTGFTYFAGVPFSRHPRETIRRLNAELKAIQEFLFSLEEEPHEIKAGDAPTEEFIRFLPKRRNGELLLICINRATRKIRADLDCGKLLRNTGAEVLFENRQVTVNADGRLHDEFPPFGRHVYKMKLPSAPKRENMRQDTASHSKQEKTS